MINTIGAKQAAEQGDEVAQLIVVSQELLNALREAQFFGGVCVEVLGQGLFGNRALNKLQSELRKREFPAGSGERIKSAIEKATLLGLD